MGNSLKLASRVLVYFGYIILNLILLKVEVRLSKFSNFTILTPICNQFFTLSNTYRYSINLISLTLG